MSKSNRPYEETRLALNDLVNAEQAAELWGVTPGHIKNLCAEGKINAVKVGKTWVIDSKQPNPRQKERYLIRFDDEKQRLDYIYFDEALKQYVHEVRTLTNNELQQSNQGELSKGDLPEKLKQGFTWVAEKPYGVWGD